MTARSVLLNVHLVLGLTAGVFLIVLGLTGSIIAFEADIPHWLHRDLFYVQSASGSWSERELVRVVENRFATARVQSGQILGGHNLARVFQLPGGVSVFVNQYDGTILGSVQGGFRSERVLGYIHQIHLRLVPDPGAMKSIAAHGKVVVSYAGLVLALLVPTGLLLFWRTRRTSVKWSASWFRVCFDLHHVIGVYAALFLMLAAVTGVLIGFDWGEKVIFALAGSGRPAALPAPHSTPAAGGGDVTIDQAIAIARATMPDGVATGYSLPRNNIDVITVLVRVPEETSVTVHSSVAVDRYSGQVRCTRATSGARRPISSPHSRVCCSS